MSAVSNRKFPYFKLYINNLSNANSQITQLYSDMQAKNSPYGDILVPGDASGLNVNGYLMSRLGLNGVPTSKKGDKYYIAVDANNKLRSGIQVNGADKITWKEVATKDDLNTCAQKEFTPGYGRWDTGIQNAYFKMKKHSGDNFLPFLKMSTDDGAWVIGVHSSLNRLVFRYYANETGAGVSVYEFDPNASPKTV